MYVAYNVRETLWRPIHRRHQSTLSLGTDNVCGKCTAYCSYVIAGATLVKHCACNTLFVSNDRLCYGLKENSVTTKIEIIKCSLFSTLIQHKTKFRLYKQRVLIVEHDSHLHANPTPAGPAVHTSSINMFIVLCCGLVTPPPPTDTFHRHCPFTVCQTINNIPAL